MTSVTTPKAGEDPVDPCTLLARGLNGRAAWGESLAVFLKTKPVTTIRPSSDTLRRLFHRNEKLFSLKNLYRNVDGSFICTTLKLGSARMAFNKWG